MKVAIVKKDNKTMLKLIKQNEGYYGYREAYIECHKGQYTFCVNDKNSCLMETYVGKLNFKDTIKLVSDLITVRNSAFK